MAYLRNLIIRLVISLFFVIFGSSLFYFLLFKPMFYLSFLLLFNHNPIIYGNSLFINGRELVFLPSCIATSAYILLCVLIFLTKDICSRKRVYMFIIGFTVLSAINLIRIYFLAFIYLNYDIGLFESLHLFMWNVFSTLFVFLLWIFLIKIFNIKEIPIYSDLKFLIKNYHINFK